MTWWTDPGCVALGTLGGVIITGSFVMIGLVLISFVSTSRAIVSARWMIDQERAAKRANQPTGSESSK